MRFGAAVAVVVAGLIAVGCGGGDEDRVVVFAASSLTDAFGELETAFESAHDGVDVVISYGGSSTLATQIDQGAPADVFAAADTETARRVASPGDLQVFATNSLVIVVEPGNPLGVESLADLARDDLLVVLAAPEVPAGRYAAVALASAGVEPAVDSYERSVRAVAGKIALGEADVGIVYLSDAAALGNEVAVVPIEVDIEATYPIVALNDSGPAHDFVAFVLGDEGRDVLDDAGFGVP